MKKTPINLIIYFVHVQIKGHIMAMTSSSFQIIKTPMSKNNIALYGSIRDKIILLIRDK